MNNNQQDNQKGFAAKLKALPDVILKLTPAVATLLAGYLAIDFQSKSAGANLLNQREQAETQLRASMFSDLISPLMGVKSNRQLLPEEERLLVEMLALNFHEHVEFKPLLLHVDQKLYKLENEAKDNEDDTEQERYRGMRKSLKSIVRRVLDRQLAVLQKECSGIEHDLCATDFNENKNVCIDIDASETKKNPLKNNPQCMAFEHRDINSLERFHKLHAPDGSYWLAIGINEADWREWTFEINIIIYVTKQTAHGPKDIPIEDMSFSVTPYDLPFTDNSILDKDHRFAIYINDVETDPDQDVTLNYLELSVVWFPPGYILSHERPFNYQEIRKVLRLDKSDTDS